MKLEKDHLIIHCSATPPSADIDSYDIDRYHRSLGWLKCGYNEVITRAGQRQNAKGGFPTRRIDEVPAHVGDCGRGWNSRSIGVCLVGGINAKGNPENNFTDAQWKALRSAVEDYSAMPGRAHILKQNIMGHRDLIKITGAPYKACPCFEVQKWLGINKEIFAGNSKSLARNEVESQDPSIPRAKLAQSHHVVKETDTMDSIAALHGVPKSLLEFLNKIEPGLPPPIGAVLRLHPFIGNE